MAAIARIWKRSWEKSCEVQVVATGRLLSADSARKVLEKRGGKDKRGLQPRERVGRGYNLENNILSGGMH